MSLAQIPVLTMGKHREMATRIGKMLAPHGYLVNGVICSPQYNNEELALALRVPEPRPQALMVGGGYTDEEAKQARDVFESYQKEVGFSTGTFVRVDPGALNAKGPDAIGKYCVEQLNATFRS